MALAAGTGDSVAFIGGPCGEPSLLLKYSITRYFSMSTSSSSSDGQTLHSMSLASTPPVQRSTFDVQVRPTAAVLHRLHAGLASPSPRHYEAASHNCQTAGAPTHP